ncbi:CapA family protein [uncultured Clostridium sp.]|uniref:CapA family protein n=1 Tax=uncultured Clostridium sp. TaxID=59620 RepID=UPI00258DFB4A|nr:CapA family protein [uncultured Clostridium sp.]
MKHTFFSKCTKMPFRYRTAFLLSRVGNLAILAGMALLLGGCQVGGSIWKETISLEPKDKTVSEETLDPETDIDGQVESEQVDGAELGVEMQGQDESGKLEAEPGENDSDECSLLFAGDIYFSNHVLNAYDRAGGIGGVLGESLRETIAEADIFMANLEFPFSDRGTQAADKQFTFRVSPSRVPILQEIGPDIVTVANNHALDYGTDALLDTCDTLDNAGILHVGAGKNLEEAKQPQIIEKNGKRIGFLGASRVFPTGGWAAGPSHPGMFSAYDTASVVQEIQKVKKECDYLVVYVHWGIERNTQPEAYQREMGHQYIDAGADLVVGSHPHVLQGIEPYHGKWILYSLGNFVFGSSIPETMLVQASVDEQGETALSIVPATSSAGYTRELETGKKAAFYQKIQGLSSSVQIDENGKVQVQ